MNRKHSKKFAAPILLSFLLLPALLEYSSATSSQRAQCDQLDGECEAAYEEAAHDWNPLKCTKALSKCTACKDTCATVRNQKKVTAEFEYCSGKLRKLQKNCPQ